MIRIIEFNLRRTRYRAQRHEVESHSIFVRPIADLPSVTWTGKTQDLAYMYGIRGNAWSIFIDLVYIYIRKSILHMTVLVDALQDTANDTLCLVHDFVLRWGHADFAENPSGTDPPWRATRRSYALTLTLDVQIIWRYGSASRKHAHIIFVLRIFDGETCAHIQVIWIPDRDVTDN